MTIDEDLKSAYLYARGWAREQKIPLTNTDLMLIRRDYVPRELEKYLKESRGNYVGFAGIYALKSFCEDFKLPSKYSARCRVC